MQQGCIISQRKTDRVGCEIIAVLLFCCFGFCLRKSARSAGDTGVSYEQYRLSPLACYSPADNADHADECSKLHYFAEKDR